VLAGANSNIRNKPEDQKHRFVTTFKAQVPVRVSLCPSAMYASLRLISAAARLSLSNRLFVRDGLILLLLLTMRGVRSTSVGSLAKSNIFIPSGYTSGASCVRSIEITTFVALRFDRRRSPRRPAQHIGKIVTESMAPNVRFWHKADIPTRPNNVRYWG